MPPPIDIIDSHAHRSEIQKMVRTGIASSIYSVKKFKEKV